MPAEPEKRPLDQEQGEPDSPAAKRQKPEEAKTLKEEIAEVCKPPPFKFSDRMFAKMAHACKQIGELIDAGKTEKYDVDDMEGFRADFKFMEESFLAKRLPDFAGIFSDPGKLKEEVFERREEASQVLMEHLKTWEFTNGKFDDATWGTWYHVVKDLPAHYH